MPEHYTNHGLNWHHVASVWNTMAYHHASTWQGPVCPQDVINLTNEQYLQQFARDNQHLMHAQQLLSVVPLAGNMPFGALHGNVEAAFQPSLSTSLTQPQHNEASDGEEDDGPDDARPRRRRRGESKEPKRCSRCHWLLTWSRMATHVPASKGNDGCCNTNCAMCLQPMSTHNAICARQDDVVKARTLDQLKID